MNGRTTIQKQFRWGLRLGAGILFLLTPGIAVAQLPETRQPDVFHLEEATIEEIHHAIQDGQISSKGWCNPTSTGQEPTTVPVRNLSH